MQPHDPTVQALAERVAKLEAQNRRLRQACLTALIVASAIAVMGQVRTSRTLEANEFVLKDTSGTVRARLSMEMTNRPTLTFYRDKTHASVSLAGGDEPFLTMWRAGTDDQVQLGATSTFYGLGLYEGAIRAGLSVQNGNPGIELYDKSGKPRAAIESDENGESILLGTDLKKSSVLTMLGKGGGFYVDLGEEGPSLHIYDNEGYSTALGRTDLLIPASGRKERTPAASLVLFGKDKNVLWSAP